MSTEAASVLVLLVASDAQSWLPDVIEGIRNQTYDDVEVLAIDNASTDRSRALLEKAFGGANVVSLDRRVGYGRALAAGLKVAAERGSTADAFLLLHDDAAMDPANIEAMVEALGRERVGIVGSKLVEWDEPDRLQEVGLTTDRYGRIYNPLERGELDQGQHDGLKEVFYSSSACLLVSRDVVERIGLFDLRYVALRDDFDLCWRARIAGYRTVVTTDARVRHVVASHRALRPGTPVGGRARYFSDRNMFASLIKNYSLLFLIVALPVTFFVSILNAVIFALTGRRDSAKQTLSALQWNIVHLPATLRLRVRSQRARTVSDRDVAKLMVRGAPRIRDYVARTFERVAGDPAIGIDEEVELGDDSELRSRSGRGFLKSHPVGIAAVLFGIVYLFGARHLFGNGGLAGADLAPFPPRTRDFFTEFFSGWRSAGTGGAAPASPALFLSGILSIVSFGSVRFAERILVLSLIPLAAASASRCAGALGLPPRAKRAAAVAYALSPLALASFSQGRIPDLILAAALPALLLPALRAGGLASAGGWRSMGAGVLGLAAVASFSPWALPAIVVASIILAGASAISGNRDTALRLALTGLVQTTFAAVLLLPWTVELFKSGSPLGARPGPYGVPLTELVRTAPGGVIPIPAVFAWAFPAIAAAGVLLAISLRQKVANTLALAGTASVLLAWAVSRGVPWIAPRPALPLTLAAVAIALLAGIAAEGLVPSLSSRSFGIFHLVFGSLAVLGMMVGAMGVGFLARGTYRGLTRAGDLVPAFFISERSQLGDFAVLWVNGDAGRLRVDLSSPSGETALTYSDRRTNGGERYLEGVVASMLARRTEQGGRLLAPLGVRYIVLRSGVDRDVERAFERQVDIRFAQRFRGAEIVANDAWLPVAGGVSSLRWVAASRAPAGSAAAAAAGAPADPGRSGALRERGPGRFEGDIALTARSLFVAQEFSGRWRATSGSARIAPARSFGWATAFQTTGSGARHLEVGWHGQGAHRAAILVEFLALIAIGGAWSRRAARERGER
jgi:GT2 family glycosyltransferase